MRLRALTVVGLATGALVLTGCSSDVSGHPTSAGQPTFPSAGGSASSSPIGGGSTGGRSASALVTKVFAAMTSATAFHVVANRTGDDGSKLAFDIRFGKSSSSGTITQDGFTIGVIALPSAVYFKGDDDFWKNIIPADSQAVALPKLRGKWVTGPSSNAGFKEIADSLNRASIVSSLTQGDPASAYSIIGTGRRSGAAVIRLHDSTDGSEVDVLASGTPFPVYSSTPTTASNGGGGTITFADWNKAYTAAPPPAADIFDVSPYLH